MQTLVIRLTANALGEDVQEVVDFIEERFPESHVQRDTGQVMVTFENAPDKDAVESEITQRFAGTASSGLEWLG